MNSKLKGMWIKGVLVIGVASALLWVFVLSPRLALPTQLEAQQTTALQKNTSVQASIAALNKKKDDLPMAEQKVAALTLKFPVPSEDQITTLTAQINTAATKAGMAISQLTSVVAGKPALSAGTATGAGIVAEITLAISATGTYDQLIVFTNNLYATPRAIVIDTVSLNSGTSIGGVAVAGSYVATIAARSFLFKAIDPVPAGLVK